MKKGVVDPWYPTDRWDTLPRSAVKDSPEAEWFLWIARLVDRIEAEGRLRDFKAEGATPNSYREAILDEVCLEAFGSKHPTKEMYISSMALWLPACFGEEPKAGLILCAP